MSGRSSSRGSFSWYLKSEDLQDRLDTNMSSACSSIAASVAVMTVHGDADADVPVGDAHKFDQAIKVSGCELGWPNTKLGRVSKQERVCGGLGAAAAEGVLGLMRKNHSVVYVVMQRGM